MQEFIGIIIKKIKLPSFLKEYLGSLPLSSKISLLSFFSAIIVLGSFITVSSITGGGKQAQLVSQNQTGKSVLAASTSNFKILGKISFNIPSTFNDIVNFSKDVTIEGTTNIKGGLKYKDKEIDLANITTGLVKGLTAGDGVSVTTGESPTIKNTGVLSIGGSTGAVNLTAGSGISVSGLTITNSDTGSSQDIFKTIKIGSDSFSAGSNTDTLEFVAGDGVTLTPDTSNKKITISGSSASGFTDGGTNVYLTTSTDSVGIGTTAPSTKFEVDGTSWLRGSGSTTGLYVNSLGNVGIGTTTPSSYNLEVSGTAGVTGLLTASGGLTIPSGQNLTVSGNLASNLVPSADNTYSLGSATNSFSTIYANNLVTTGNQSGFWQRDTGALSPTNITDSLLVGGTTTSSALLYVNPVSKDASFSGNLTVAPSTDGVAALRVKAAPGTTGNIFEITNSAGTGTPYLALDNAGVLAVGGYKLTNAGLFESSGAISLTSLNKTLVGTAIEGGWTMNSNTFTYRRQVTVINNDGSTTLPTGQEITLSLSDLNASDLCSNSRSDSEDIRIAYNSTEIARNITRNCSTSMTISFKLQSDILASQSDTNYYIYYSNSALSSGATTYNSNTLLNGAEDTTGWTSGNDGFFALSQDLVSPEAGSASLKVTVSVGKIKTLATTSQGQLTTALSNQNSVKMTITATDYVYTLGGTTDGSAGTTAIYKSTFDGSGNISAPTAQVPTVPAAVHSSAVVPVAAIVGGTGADGSLDVSATGIATTCNNPAGGLSYSGTTCTIATATKSTFNFTTINVASGYTLTTSGTTFPVLYATGAVTISGTVDLTGKVAADSGTGAGGAGSTYSDGCGGTYAANGGGGGGHNGAGGSGGAGTAGGAAGGSAYGTDDSLDFGSGGGSGYGGSGGTGGGGIKIVSAGDMTISGTISANGGGASLHSGGGSGGKIILEAPGKSITNTGTITTNGGNGETSNCPVGGGGSGGKIILKDNDGVINGTITANAGSGYHGYGCSGQSGDGAAGKIAKSAESAGYYVYVIGGINNSTASSTVYRAVVNGSTQNVDSIASTSQTALPQNLYGATAAHFAISSVDYIYIFGGHNGTSAQTVVYKATIDANGNFTTVLDPTTSQTQLPSALYYQTSAATTINGGNYVYLIGGLNSSGTAQSTVYKATVNSSANVSAVATEAGATGLPALSQASAFIATIGSNTYLYVVGGKDSNGNPTNAIYKALLDSTTGDVGAFSSTGQGSLEQTLYGHSAFAHTVGSDQYAYVVGGTNASPVTAVSRGLINDISDYTATYTMSSTDLSGYNDIQFYVKSSKGAGSYLKFEVQDSVGGWQTCTDNSDFTTGVFSISGTGWEQKTCRILNMTRAHVTGIRFTETSASTSSYTINLDDIWEKINVFSGTAPTNTVGNTLSGAADLTLNAQGTGAILLNYDKNNGLAGQDGLKVYDGAMGLLFRVTGTGDASASGSLVMTGASSSASLDILNGQNLNFQTSLGGDAGLTSRMFLNNGGNLGIGTTSPIGLLNIEGAPVGKALVNLNYTGSGDNIFTASASGVTKFLIDASGNASMSGTLTASTIKSPTGALNLQYKSGADAWTTGLTIKDNTGNIGIGTAGPLGQMELLESSYTSNQLVLSNGIAAGTAIPAYAGSLLPSLMVRSSETSNSRPLYFGYQNGSAWDAFMTTGACGSFTQLCLDFGTGTTMYTALESIGTRLNLGGGDDGNFASVTMMPSGGVGIGTTSPLTSLHVDGINSAGRAALIVDQTAANVNDIFAASSAGVLKFKIANDGTASSAGDLVVGQGKQIKPAYGALNLAYKSGADAWTTGLTLLDNSGNVGIGTTSPMAVLHVVGSSAEGTPTFGPEAALVIQNNNNSTSWSALSIVGGSAGRSQLYFSDKDAQAPGSIQYDHSANALMFFTNGNEQLHIDSSGEVGIGTATPSATFQVGNQGDASTARANAWTTFSDIRFKENIATISGALDKVLALNGVSFNWKNSGLPSIGFIAQDVEKVVPEIVSTDSQGFKSMDYSKVTPLLVNAIKEQQSQIASLSSKFDSLQNIDKLNFVSLGTSSADIVTIKDSLLVLGTTSLTDLYVGNQISVDNNLTLGSSSINTIGTDLELQPLKQGGISMFSGVVKIDTDGNITTTGNITAQNITAQGVLSAKTVNIIKDNFKDLSSTESAASASAATSFITAGKTIRKIYSPLIKSDSLIYITPIGDTDNQVLFISDQKENSYFTVSIKDPVQQDIKFNFLIVNQKE